MAKNLQDLIDFDLLAYFKSKLDLLFAGKVDKEQGKGLSSNDYTSNEKTKLANIAAGAQVNTIEGVQIVGNSIAPANKIVNIPAATQSAPGAMSAADKTKLDGVAAGAQENVIESVKRNGTALTVTNKEVDISVPTTVAELTDASDYATKDYVDTNGGKIDIIKVNGTAQPISGADKSVDLDIDDIAWFQGSISTNAFNYTSISANASFPNIVRAIQDGKYPVMVASYTNSYGTDDYKLYMPLTKFYPERSNQVTPIAGDVLAFEGQRGNDHYELTYKYELSQYRWVSTITSFASESEASRNVQYFDFTCTGEETQDGYLIVSTNLSSALSAILTAYNSNYAVFANVAGYSDNTIVLPIQEAGEDWVRFCAAPDEQAVSVRLFYDPSRTSWLLGGISLATYDDTVGMIDNIDDAKVDKEDGKGLSTNDYTTAEKNKLAGIATGAQVNVIESVKVNGTSLPVSSKSVNVTVPTKTSDITNDSGFITINDVPEGAAASSTVPLMDGTASTGSETAFARGDHVHPHDSTKVDKVSGKGLSTEDYTTAEKTKLSGIATGAQVNVIEGISTDNGSSTLTPDANKIVVLPTAGVGQNGLMGASDYAKLQDVEGGAQVNVIESVWVNGSQAPISNKAVEIDVPTTVAELTDASDYVTDLELQETLSTSMSAVSDALDLKADASSVYTKTEIDQKLVGAMNYKGTKATTSALPATGNTTGDVWHVTADSSEWAWNGSAWEELGAVIDLSGYVQSSDLGLATNADIDGLFT